jgi:serine/threonine protein kinase
LPILRHEERIGSVLAGRFRLDAILGRGGMGVVFKGVEVATGVPVAIKLLHYEYAERPDVVSRFIREANTVRALEHPHIVRVFDLGQEEDGTVYLVLEFLAGQSLGERLADVGVLGAVEAADVLLPVVDALSFAHSKGVIHRDLKPDNIFLTHGPDDKLVPKLLDFGIAKTLDKDSTALTQTGFVLGTPEYMSPEQAHGGAGVGAGADIYSMGVVFYECLSGSLPTGDLQGTAILVATATGRTTPLRDRAPWLPKTLTDAVDRALRVDARERYADMDSFGRAMAQACGVVRSSGEIRAPEGTLGRRQTRMGLKDPEAKASSPSLAAFHQRNAYELGPMAPEPETTALSAVPVASRASAPQGTRGSAVVFAALALIALGAGGAVALGSRRDPAPLSPPTVVAPATPVAATTATPANTGQPQEVRAEPTRPEPLVERDASVAIAPTGSGNPRTPPRRTGETQPSLRAAGATPSATETPSTTPQPSRPTTATNAASTAPVAAQPQPQPHAQPRPTSAPLSEYE